MAISTARQAGSNSKATIHRIVAGQFLVAGLAALFSLTYGKTAAVSALLGGLTCALPSLIMAWKFGREVADTGAALGNLVRGEIGKLALTVVMFIATFVWVKPLMLGVFLIVLALGLLCNVLVPLFFQMREQARRQTK